MTVLHTSHHFFLHEVHTCKHLFAPVWLAGAPPPLLAPFLTSANSIVRTASVDPIQPQAGGASLFWAVQDHQAPASVNRWTSSRGRPDLRRGLFSVSSSSNAHISSFALFQMWRLPLYTCCTFDYVMWHLHIEFFFRQAIDDIWLNFRQRLEE